MLRNSKKKFKYWTISLLAILTGVCVLLRLYFALTDDFRLGNISGGEFYEEILAIPPLSDSEEQSLQKILGQNFTYLGKGAQCYAFGSQDGRYILKFFKFKHLRPSLFWESMPSLGPIKPYKEKLSSRKWKKLLSVFGSHKLAYEVAKQESGLIFVQLNTLGNPKRQVHLRDKIGLWHDYNLEHIPFVVQRKGEVLRDVLEEKLNKRDILTAQKEIGQIFEMYDKEYRKGIFDHDHGVLRNVGFVDNQPFHLDVGKLMKNPSIQDRPAAKQDLLRVKESLERWIQKKFPDDFSQLQLFMDQKVEELFE